MNLENYLNNNLEANVSDVEIINEDGSEHTDSNYQDYKVLEVKYKTVAVITVSKR